MSDATELLHGLSTSETARALGVSADRVRQLARSGALPCTPTRYGRVFDPSEVEAFASARTPGTRNG